MYLSALTALLFNKKIYNVSISPNSPPFLLIHKWLAKNSAKNPTYFLINILYLLKFTSYM